MINLLNVKPQDSESAKLYVAMTQGQWGFETGYDTDGTIQIDKVDADADAQLAASRLGLVAYFPVKRDGDEDDYDALSADDMVVFISASGVDVEDDKLATNSTTTTWSGLSFGDALVVNTSGYLTSSAAADAPASATEVAMFLKYENGIVFYRTL